MAGLNPQEIIAEVLEQIRGMWRFRWAALGAAWAISVGGWLYVYTIPDVYSASAKVSADTNNLLRPLVQGLTATSNTLNEVDLLSRAVLTRPNLEEIAYETDLALRARNPYQMESLITRLQETIRISGGRDNVYTITYEDVSREMARDVVAAVVDKFIESALGSEGEDAEVSERALANEIEVHVRRLREAEAALAAFKQENLGYMPGEYGDYYERLQAALNGITATQERLRLLEERRIELNRQLVGEEPVFGIMPSTGAGLQCSQSAHIAQLEAEISSLMVDFTDKHPRVASLQSTIEQFREECRQEMEVARASGRFAASQAQQPLEVNPVYQNMRIQLTDTEVEIAELRARLVTQQEEVSRLRRDVDKITQVEAELKELNRNYDVIYARHQEYLRRWEDLQAKKRLDPVADNVQFQRIEPPFAAAEPIGPNRPLLLAAVLVFAVGASAAGAFGLNQVQPTFFTRNSLRRAVGFPVLGSISMILTPEAVRKRRLATVGWFALVLMLFASAFIAVTIAPQASDYVQRMMPGAGA